MKPCTKCGVEKEAGDFYPRNNQCKACVKLAVQRNYRANREHFREYEQSRAQLPHRVLARENYAKTEKGRSRSKAAKKAYIERNPEKRKAHIAFDNALKGGRVWKSPCCMAPGCFSTDRIHGHHSDYEKPLSVTWLCVKCHAALHREHDNRQTRAA